MSCKAPAVSVILPVRNGAAFLGEAIESILEQTFSDFELIIIDDASNDATPEILQSYRDERLVLRRNIFKAGIAASLNVGLRIARGELTARMDADDVAEKKRLETQVSFMQQHPHVVLCGSEALRIGADGGELGPIKRLHTDLEIKWHLLTGNPYIHPSIISRTEAVRRIGGYSENLTCAQDYELWCRLAPLGEFANLSERLVKYRYHAGAVSATKRQQQLEITQRCSQRFLLDQRLALTAEEAIMFQFLSTRHFNSLSLKDYSYRQLQRFPEMVECFFSRYDTRDHSVQDSISRVRQRLRQRILSKMNAPQTQLIAKVALMNIARKVDPSGIRLTSISKRMLQRAMKIAKGGKREGT